MNKIKIDIIDYKEKYSKIGYSIIGMGIGALFLNLIPNINEIYRNIISLTSLLVAISGIVLVNISELLKIKKGEIIISYEYIIIITDKKNILNRIDFNINIKEKVFLGRSNYIPFLSLGSFSSSSGITKITISNKKCHYEYNILIKNKKQLDRIVLLSK